MTTQARELLEADGVRLARARAVTEEQLAMAFEIAAVKGAGTEHVGAILHALALNYAAAIESSR